jgi:hypothetical protein
VDNGDVGSGNGRKRRPPCNGTDRGFTSPETELTSRWCSNARPLVEPTNEAIANDGGVSHWCSFTHCRDWRCDSAAD